VLYQHLAECGRVAIWIALVSILTLSWGVYSIDVVEIIHGQCLEGFLLLKGICIIGVVFVLGNPSIIIISA